MVVEKKEIRKVNVASKTQTIVFMMFALDVLVPFSCSAQIKRRGIGSVPERFLTAGQNVEPVPCSKRSRNRAYYSDYTRHAFDFKFPRYCVGGDKQISFAGPKQFHQRIALPLSKGAVPSTFGRCPWAASVCH